MDIRLFVDEKEIKLNKFVKKMLSGTIEGAVMSLTGIEENWKEIQIKVTKQT